MKVCDSYSDEMTLGFGMPQRSVLGPMIFNIYLRSFYGHIHSSGFDVVGFDHDNQLMKQFVATLQIRTIRKAISENCDMI